MSAELKNGQGRVCVSITGNDTQSVLDKARAVQGCCDVIEVRLDSMAECSPGQLVSGIEAEVLFTNRPEWEGGWYKGTETDRVDLLLRCVESGASFVDLELNAPDESHERVAEIIKGSATRLILSNHDFEGTQPAAELLERIHSMHDRGADIGKLITTARGYEDALNVLFLQVEAARLGMDLIAFCMGGPGVITRLSTLDLGGFMTYCAPGEGGGTASGQIPVAAYQQIRELMP